MIDLNLTVTLHKQHSLMYSLVLLVNRCHAVVIHSYAVDCSHKRWPEAKTFAYWENGSSPSYA